MGKNEVAPSWANQFTESSAATFFLLLFLADCVFIFLHLILVLTPFMENPMFSLELDHGYPEAYQYVKEFWIVILLFLVLIKTKSYGYLLWTILFMYFLLDDALQVHENVGHIIAVGWKLEPLFDLRSQDFGELAVSTVVITLFLIPLVWFYVRGGESFRRATRHLMVLVVAIAFFGVFIDLVHILVEPNSWISMFMGVIEDGGEMVAMSAAAWYAFLLHLRRGNIGTSRESPKASSMPAKTVSPSAFHDDSGHKPASHGAPFPHRA